MKKKRWMGIILVVITLISAAWLLRGYFTRSSEEGFKLVFLEDNEVLISDDDVLSYNWTSQEIAISDPAVDRLLEKGDSLYSFAGGFVIRIDGEELYRGVFRMAIHSAIPESPRVSILFPSMLFPSATEKPNSIRMFYPFFEPPADQPEASARLSDYFEDAGKLSY